MRRAFVIMSGVLAACAGACAMISGLDDPGDAPLTSAPDDGSATSDSNGNGDVAPADDGAAKIDADAGRVCVGAIMMKDSFVDRDAAAVDGWTPDNRGEAGVIQVTNGNLYIRVPPAVTDDNLRRQLVFGQSNVKRICASYTVEVKKPQDTSAYTGKGDTTFGFIGADGIDGGSYYYGIMVAPLGLIVYAQRGGANDENRAMQIPLTTKWNVFMEADYVADTLTIAVNDKVETMSLIRPSETPSASFFLGVRNFGPAPEAEALFDDVVVGIDQ